MLKKNIMNLNKSVRWETVIFILYTIIMFFTVLYHEPWRDEAQAWLIARDLPFFSIFSQMGYEGTPALWHVILAPFAKLGFPYISINLIHLAIIYFAAALFIYKSPFSIITKVLFIFSYYMSWEYSIIARNYSISILLLFLIATLYGDRFKKPIMYAILLFLLFNTNAHSFLISVALVSVFLFESYKNREINAYFVAIFIMFFGGVLSLFQLLSPLDNINYGLFLKFNLDAPYMAIRHAFFPHMSSVSDISLIAGITLLFASSVYLFKVSREVLFILFVSYMGLFYIFIFKHPGGYRHHGFILILLLFTLWISHFYNRKLIVDIKYKLIPFTKSVLYSLIILLLNISLAISIIPAVTKHRQEFKLIFSGAKEMATYLKTNNLTDNIIVAHRSPHSSSILPYIPKVKFWYADIEQYGTFITWNKIFGKNNSILFEEIVNRIHANNLPKNKLLILSNKPIPVGEIHNYQLLHKVETGIFGYGKEKYYLYKPIILE